MVNYLDSRRIMGTTSERSSIPVPATQGGWVELGRTTLGSAGNTIDVTGLTAKRYLMVLHHVIKSGSSVSVEYRYNNDSGSNYARRHSFNGAVDNSSAGTPDSKWNFYGNSTDLDNFAVTHIANYSTKEKLATGHGVFTTATGSSTAPIRVENVGKWVNTSDQINRLEVINSLSGSMASGSEVVVLGWDPADTHTTNFWEELADVSWSSGDTIDTGTFTAKKYLWIQGWYKGGNSVYLRVNSDTGNNYARRHSPNGGTDDTAGNVSGLATNIGYTDTVFFNGFIINNTSNEKLCILNMVSRNTAGAANAPYRLELVSKWANTSTQITSIQLTDDTDDLTGGQIKVWGSD